MPQAPTASSAPRRFDFGRDTFAFANELAWEYRFDPGGGRPRMEAREPRPSYVLRCFVLARAVRQFFLHAEFRADAEPGSLAESRACVRQVLRRNPRIPSSPGGRVGFPGYDGLRSFSRDREGLLKAECGGAWRSYVLRSHWRMVFPITRAHQDRTYRQLTARLARGQPAIVHLVRFPQLTINHGMTLYAVEGGGGQGGTRFLAYDPNDPSGPSVLSFDGGSRTFFLPANRYWAGGPLDVIEIYRSWWF